MITLDINRVKTHTTLLLHVGDKNYPAEIKNHEIRRALSKTSARDFSVELIKGWRTMLLRQARIDIMKQPYLKNMTSIVNKMISFFENFS